MTSYLHARPGVSVQPPPREPTARSPKSQAELRHQGDHSKAQPRAGSGQRGAVLITALIFLVILTLLGTTGVMNNALQERMAGNARNRDLAFQAAEHALKAADTWMMTGNNSGPQTKTGLKAVLDPNGDGNYADQTPNDGIRPSGETHSNDGAYWQSANWLTDVRSPPGANLSYVLSQPRYVVERLPSGQDCDTVTAGNQPCDYYRITARGVGGTGEAAVILQTLYQVY